ncbi:MAG TPA: VIT and VWA domain-containing protein [Bryobacteraceae bacterium]|nr:VIT and VWA domain-containing protein [Bryobacteraceae bacterium]
MPEKRRHEYRRGKQKCLRHVFLLVILSASALADTGVLIPGNRQQPDPAVFSLNEMELDIRIDNGVATVAVRQIFGNHSGSVQEGVYQFALPDKAAVSNFAVWDGITRIPGVILERRRAGEIYAQAKAQAIDPGLLQMGERDADEASRSQQFTAKIVPIPRFGTKRVEMEYQHPVAVERYQSEIVVPLKPDVFGLQTARHFTLHLELRSAHAIKDFSAISKLYPLQVRERTANSVKADFSADNLEFKEDFTIRYELDAAEADTLRVITERDAASEPGFFQAQTLLGIPKSGGNASGAPARALIVLFDTSLSMQWDKLERSFAACEAALRRLRPVDTFNLMLFNSELNLFAPQPRPATPENIEQALTFIRNSRIRGGTNLERALTAALQQTTTHEPYILLVGDGGPTEGTIHNGKLAAWYAAEWRKRPVAQRPHTLVFGVGDDANQPLLRMLASNNGHFDWVLSTEPIEFKLNAFLNKIGEEPVKNLTLTVAPQSGIDLVYPLEDSRFAGSMATWAGRYQQPTAQATFTVQGIRNGQALRISATAPLPAAGSAHPDLPRTWAKARVDALLDKIAREGEDRASIDEIIKLSKKYKFVTPYTSFLAVPRSLLRPRVIRPGDPVLRLKTDPSIISVIALFPFGLTKPLRYLKQEDTWQTRFLAPVDMADGEYQVRVILRDRDGHVYREAKSFVIASKTPVLRARLERPRVHAGETLRISAQVTGNARTITARLYGAAPVPLRWSSAAKANTGELVVPSFLPPGKYAVHVTAEDIAHNIGTEEVSLEIW